MRVMTFSIVALMVSGSCQRARDCDFNGAYEFEIPVTFYPAIDTFYVKDTIRISSRFSKQVFEKKTGRSYTLNNFKFFPTSTIYRMDTLPPANDEEYTSLKSFDKILYPQYDYQIVEYSNGSSALVGEYNYDGTEYSLEFSLIPNHAGLYSFSFGSELISFGSDQGFENKCDDASIDAFVKINDGAENNITFLSSSPNPHWSDWVLQKPNERYHKFGGYTFYVIE